jgi:hypothetical protein
MEMQHGHGQTTLGMDMVMHQRQGHSEWTRTWTYSIDMTIQHSNGPNAWTWKFSMDLDTQHGFDNEA